MANEQALQDLYKEFVKTGYRGSKEDFKGLMSSNDDAFQDGYKSFTSTGYNGNENDFAELLGVTVPVKKKENLQENGDGTLEDGQLLSEEAPQTFKFGERPSEEELKRTAPQSTDPNAPRYIEEVKLDKKGNFDGIRFGEYTPKDRRDPYYSDPVSALGMYPFGDGKTQASVELQIKTANEDALADRQYTDQLIADEVALKYPNQANSVEERDADMDAYLREQKELSEKNTRTVFTEKLDVNNRKYFLEERKPFKDKELLEKELQIINTDLINEDDNSATIQTLSNQFGKYGFVFQKSYGSVTARATDGSAEITIDIDPVFGVGAEAQVSELQNFLMLNSSEIEGANTDMDFIGKSLKAQNMRRGQRHNKDGTVSSHLMSTFEQDGKFLVVPTLFPKDDENQASYPNNWIELSGDEALKKAEERGEVIEFDSKVEADIFALGAWKNVNTVDVEAQNFYADRGLDYQQVSQSFNLYQDTRDRIDFIEDLLDTDEFGLKDDDPTMGDGVNRVRDLTLKDQAKYADLYVNGELRDDIEGELKRLKEQETGLFDTAFNDEVKEARTEFDLYLRKKQQKLVGEAVFINDKVKEKQSEIDEVALIRFGEKPMDLAKAITETTTRQDLVEMNKIQTETLNLNFERKNAAMLYENSELYLNRMENKKIMSDFVDNLAGFSEEFGNGLEQGHAANAILQYAMGVDLLGGGDDDDVNDIAMKIVEAMRRKSGNQSKTMLSWEDSEGFKEAWDVVKSDPAEWTTQLAGKSIAMMLPYGAQLIPMGGVIGAGTGAVYGAAGMNPYSVAGGATVGLGYGLRVGFAATTYAMEYTNSILEAISESGYDIYNPDEVAMALQDQKVWDVGGARGHARGIPIAIIDYLTAGLAGRLFMPAKFAITSRGVLKTAGLITAERLVLDPIGEGVGETLAQENEMLFGTGRKELDYKEIAAEMGGAIGNQGSNAIVNMTLLNSNRRRAKLLADFTNPEFLASYSDATPEQIMNFLNKNIKLGKIDASKGKAISDNLGVLRDAQELLGENADPAALGRVMRLLEAKENLTSTMNRRELFSDYVKNINAELSSIVLTGKFNPEKMAETGPIDPLNDSKFDSNKFNQFKIGTSTYETPEEFVKAVNSMSKEALMKSNLSFTINDNQELSDALNDYVVKKMLGQEQESFKIENYANTEQSTTPVSSNQQTESTEEVAEGVPGPIQESTQESQEKEEVTTDVVVAPTTEEQTEDQDVFNQQVQEMEDALDNPESKVDFRLKDENKVEPDRDEVEAITQRINLLDSDNVNTKIETEESNVKLDVQELNNRTDTDLQVTSIELVDGIPTAFTISDQLTTGNVVNPNTGTTIDNLKGSIGFNGTTGNEQAAWAGTTKSKAEQMLQNAEFIYQANKPKIDEFWANNPQYNGLVPVNVVKMAESGIISNEAMFRILADNLTKIPEENKVKALEALKTEIINRRDKSDKKKPFNDIISLLEGKDIQSIDDVVAPEFVQKLGLGARVNLMNIIGYGTPNKPGQTKKAGAVSELSSVTTALLENQDVSARELLNIASIAEIITDKQMKDVPEGSIVAIVGVDVLNPGVVETTHPNYKYGVRGKSMGVLTNPVSMEKAYPVAYKKAMGSLIEKESQGKKVTGKQLRTNQTGLGIGIPSKDYIGAKAGSQSNINKLNNFLNISFPGTTIYTDSETFKIVMNTEGVMKYSKGKQTVYGVTVNGDIYINPDVHNSESELFNTSIHEMGHVWTDYIQTSKKGKVLYKRGTDLVKKTSEYQRQLKKFDGNEKKAVDETMAILIGNKGETIANATLQSKFQEWLLGMWKYIKESFKMSEEYTEAEIQDITLDEFIGSALADIFSGKKIELTDVQQKQLKNPEAMFKQGMSSESMVVRGRELAMPDNVIAEVLRKRNGLKDAEIVAMLSTSVPTAFTNVKGGINVGEQIYNAVEEQRQKRFDKLPKFKKDVLISEDGGKTFSKVKEDTNSLKIRKEERAARKKDLENNKLFKQQPVINQKQMIAAYDAMLGTKANQEVQQEIDVILAELKGRKDQSKVSADIRTRLKNYIRKVLPTVSKVNKSELASLLKTMAEVDDVNFVAEVLRVQEIVSQIQVKDRQSVLDVIKKYVNKKSKDKRTNKKPKSGSLEYRGQEYFKVLNQALNMSRENFNAKKVELSEKAIEIEEALLREANLKEGKSLTKKDSKLLAEAEIYARYDNLESKSIEELNDIFNSIKNEAKDSRQKLLSRQNKRREKFKVIKDEADKSIEENFPFLYGKKGLKTDREVEQSRKSNLEQFREKGFLKFMKDFADGIFSPFTKTESGGRNFAVDMRLFFDNIITNTQGIYNILDGRYTSFFTKYFQKPLSKANFKREQGVRDFNRYINDLAERAGFKNKGNLDINKAYYNFKLSLAKKELLVLEGIDITENSPEGTFANPTNDQLAYIYAISKNPDVRARLSKQGFTEEMLERIEKHLGKDVIGFIDLTVDHLSNDSYDSINEVYVRNNDVNLDKIENYFPLATKLDPTSEEKSIGFQSDAFSTFSAESPSSLKMRSDKSVINPATSFVEMLDSHIESTERYKAYADLVPQLNRILKIPSVKLLLKESGLTGINNEILNFSINGSNNFETGGIDSRLVNSLQGMFVSYVLGLKLWQIPKQMSSFIEAFKKFRYKGNLAYQKFDKATLGIPATAVDALMFVGRYAQTLGLTLAGMEGGIKTAAKMSAGFEQRMLEALSGKNLVELESGTKTGKGIGFLSKYLNLDGTFTIAGTTLTLNEMKGYVKSFIGAGTSIGDVLGVMGYMANYNQDIANGMSETEATLEFIEYNLTQQSRRDMDKGGLQRRAGLLRLLTMFGSTMFLQMNNTAVNMRNIMRSIRNGKVPSKTDIRGFVISGAVANMAFQTVANMMLLTKGDEDEKLSAQATIKKQATGFTQLTKVPILGAVAEESINYLMGEKGSSGYSESGAVEPLKRIIREVTKGLKEEDYLAAIKPIVELRVGFQFDPIEGVYNTLNDNGDMETNIYDMVNMPKTQRPGGSGSSGGSLPPIWMIETLDNPELLQKVKDLNKKKREAGKKKRELIKKAREKL